MKSSGRAARSSVAMARDLIPPAVRARLGARLFDVGDRAGNGSLGFPTREATPARSFTEAFTSLSDVRGGSQDAVVFIDCIERFPYLELRVLFARTFKALGPGGYVVIVWTAPWWARLRGGGARGRRNTRTKREVLACLKAGGFRYGGAGSFRMGTKLWAWATK